MASQTDIRQLIYRPLAARITAAAGSAGDTIITALNSEITPPLALQASTTPSLVVNIGNITVTNPSSGLNRSVPPISNLLPTFTSGTVTLSSSGAGSATPSVGSAISLGMTASQFMKVGININSVGSLILLAGTPAGTLAAATTPAAVSNTFSIGFIVVRTDASNNVQNVLNSDIYQYVGGGGSGSGSGNGNTALETLKNEFVDSPYQLVTPNIMITDGQTKLATLTGATYDQTSSVVKFTADGQTIVSTQSLDPNEFLTQSLDVGSIDLSLFWNLGSTQQAFATPKSSTIQNAAVTTTNASSTVAVFAPLHGLTTGQKVYVQTLTTVGGLTAANLSSTSTTSLNTVTVVDANNFTYVAGAIATSAATGSLDWIVFGFIYQVSRDGGNNYFPVPMAQVGLTNTFRGNLRFDAAQSTEATSTSFVNQTVQDSTFTLNATTAVSLDQPFVLASTTRALTATLNLARGTGTPVGNLFVSIVRDVSGSPSSLATDIIAQSNPISITSLALTTSQTNYTVTLPGTTLPAGTYHLVVSSDAAYKAAYTTANSVIFGTRSTGATSPFTQTLNGTTWSIGSTNETLKINGRVLDLRVKLTSAGAGTYPTGLDGYGIFYYLQDVGVVGATKKTQRFVFNSVTDNLSSFTITAFNPDPDLLSCYWIEGGQVFKAPSFTLNGNVVTFPTGTFNQAGVSQTITLVFDQNTGGAFDNSDTNARLAAANHLGSTSGADDKSAAGRGIVLRDANGTLREIALDVNDNLQVMASPGGSALKSIGANYIAPSTGTPAGLSGQVPAAGLPGRTDGNPVASGNVGQVIGSGLSSPVSIATSVTNITSITVTPGIWLMTGQATTIGGTSTGTYILGYISTGGTTGTGANGTFGMQAAYDPTGKVGSFGIVPPVLIVTANTTYYLNAQLASGTVSMQGHIQAVRIA